MAEIVKTVRIETGGGERTVKSLKKEISDLRDALLNLDSGGTEWKKTADELTKAQEELNTVMKAGKQAVDADASSIAGMENRYKSLYATYRLLSQEQRKTAEGISMQKELAELSKNLNNVKKDAGNFKDNIGHYADDMMNAFGQLGISVGALQGPFKLASQGAVGFKTALNTLAKHPVLLTLAALVGLFAKVRDAIKGNEELQLRLNKAMAAFKPVGDAVALILDKVASLAVKVAEGLAKVFKWVTDLLGVTKRLSEAELALADSQNELIKQRREYEAANSNDEARVQELLEEASLTDNIREKEQLLIEAREIQEKINQRNIELRQKEYDIIKATNAITPSSTEDLNKENAALVALNQARANGERSLRRINNQIKSAQNSGKSAAESAKKELDDILKRLDENSKTEIQKLTDKYEKEKKILEKYHKDTTALTKEYEKNVAKIESDSYITRTRSLMEFRANIDRYLQPSTAAYTTVFGAAQADLEDFIKYVEKKLGGETMAKSLEKAGMKLEGEVKKRAELFYQFDASQLFENGELSNLGNELNEIFGAGITAADKQGDAINKVNAALQIYRNRIAEADKNLEEWQKSLAEERKELELLKTTYENNLIADASLDNLSAYTEALAAINVAEGDLLKERAERTKATYDIVKNLNEEQLNAMGYTLNDQLDLQREYYEALDELRQHDLERQLANREREKEIEEEKKESIKELTDVSLDALDSMLETYSVLLDAYKKDGKISEEEAKKKAKTLQWLEGIQGAVAVAGIVADTAAGWMKINQSQAAEYVLNAETAAATGPAAAATKAALDAKTTLVHSIRKAALIVNGVAAAGAAVGKTIASIKSLGGDSDDSGGGSASAAPQLIDSTPYSYTRELQTDVEREEQLNTPIYVKVTDIESAQARVRVTENETTF